MVTTTTWTAKELSFVMKVWNTSSVCLLKALCGKTALSYRYVGIKWDV